MRTDHLLALTEAGYSAGQAHFAELGRSLLGHAPPDLAATFGAARPSLYLEPLLFAHFKVRGSAEDLLQIGFGYLPDHHRPKRVSVQTNQAGVVCLPNLGYVVTDAPDSRITIVCEAGAPPYRAEMGSTAAGCSLLASARSVCAGIEIDLHHHPLFGYLSAGESDDGADLARTHLGHLQRAVDLIRGAYPIYSDMMSAVTKRIILFRNEDLNSFVSLASFGAVCLNVLDPEADEVFFIEDLVHQCGHVIFSALTHEVESVLAVPTNMPLESPFAGACETRTVYTALHGIYTEAVMNRCFDLCLGNDSFSGRQQHELIGRFALIFRRFHYDLTALGNRALYTERGAEIYEGCRQIFEDIYDRRRHLLTDHDFTDQPYSFSYGAYRRRNPQ
ncbi:MAG: hypothetical protein GY937_21165 [bacterium]|nr:hypothetical protein [bacterium]